MSEWILMILWMKRKEMNECKATKLMKNICNYVMKDWKKLGNKWMKSIPNDE